jgi:hypothetical protein
VAPARVGVLECDPPAVARPIPQAPPAIPTELSPAVSGRPNRSRAGIRFLSSLPAVRVANP